MIVNTKATIGTKDTRMPYIYYPFDTSLIDWGRNTGYDAVYNDKIPDKIKKSDGKRDYYIYWGWNNENHFKFFNLTNSILDTSRTKEMTISFWYSITAYIANWNAAPNRDDGVVYEATDVNSNTGIKIKFLFPLLAGAGNDFNIEVTITYDGLTTNTVNVTDSDIGFDTENWHHLAFKIGNNQLKVYRDKLEIYSGQSGDNFRDILYTDYHYLGARHDTKQYCRFDMADFAIYLNDTVSIEDCYNLTTTNVFSGEETLNVKNLSSFDSIQCWKLYVGKREVTHRETHICHIVCKP